MAIRTELTSSRLLHDFAVWCTIACLNRIASSNWVMATIFTIIFINMLALFIYISVLCVIKYLSLPVATELSIDVTAQKFPRISVCNENPLKRSVIDSMPEFAEISRLIDQFERIALNKTTDDDFGLGEVRGFMHRQRRAHLMLRLLMAKVPDEARRAAGYNYTEMLAECTYSGKTCSSRDFSSFLHPDYGNCYTFAIDGNATRPGRKEGLRLMMTVNQQPTDKGPFDYMPTTDAAAVWAVIHDADAFPDFTKNGFRIAAGTQALVALSKVEYSRVALPYGNCSEHGAEQENYYENYTYTHAHCQNSWLQGKAVEICGCTDPLFRKNDSHVYCQKPDERAPLCDCPQQCTETVYKRTISTSVFPSDQYLVSAGTQAQRSALLDQQNGGRSGVCNDEAEMYDDQQTACSSTQGPTMTTTASGTKPTTTVTTATSSAAPSVTSTIASSTSASSTTDATTMTTTMTTPASASSTTTSDAPAMTAPTTTQTVNRKDCPNSVPQPEVLATLSASARACMSDNVFTNPKLTVISGWPCLSTKPCQSCVFIKNQSDPLAWPCYYNRYPEECEDRKQHVVHGEWCKTFFEKFDFIPWGTSEPVFGWSSGEGPTSVPCGQSHSQTDRDCRVQQQCGLKNVSVRDPNPLLDDQLTDALAGAADTWPCLVSTLARAMAMENATADATTNSPGSGHGSGTGSGLLCTTLGLFCPKTSGGKRKKRSVDPAGQPAPAAIDVPGFGSCEYANKNFRGAKECVQWYRRNGLVLHVFFESFEVRTYTQAATYTLVALLSDIAGHAGLWLGMSVVSVVEICAFFLMWLVKWCFAKKVKITDEVVVEGAAKRGREERKMYQ